jgi:hypothetical protein
MYLTGMDAGLRAIRGGWASQWGQTYNVYRAGSSTSGSYLNASPVITGFQMTPIFKATKTKIENQTFDLVIAIGECDDTALQIGDILVETGYEAEAGDVLVYAQRRPLRESLFVRCESNITITRPQPHGGQAAQQPGTNTSIAAAGYMGVDKASEWGLVLNSGVYSFTNTPGATLASVPAGLSQLNRLRDASDPKIPAPLYREHFVTYIPLLTGYQPTELDRFNYPNSDRYEHGSIFTSEATGLVGYVIIVEKTGT